MFQLYYTEDIVAETIAKIRDKHPEFTGGKITRIADLLRQTMIRLDDFSVDPSSYPGRDEGDLHVHSAAQSAGIDKLLTYDNGFLELPDAEKDLLNYEIFAPDDFFMLVQNSDARIVRTVTQQQFQYWKNKSGSRPDLPQHLVDAGCPCFAAAVEQHVKDLYL